MIKELKCKSALNKVNGPYPFNYDLNIYRGCTHGCKYCYALYSHKYIDAGDFYSNLYYKGNIIPILDKELSLLPRDKIVNIGGICDSYQPAEKHFKLMREVLELFIKYRIPAIISTKSDLILRDIDLIDRLSSVAYVSIAASVITMDNSLVKLIEPGAMAPEKRIVMLKEIKNKTSAGTGIHCMPILPFITDDEKNLRKVFARAKDAEINYLLTSGLSLRGETGTRYSAFIKDKFPEIYPEFIKLQNKALKKEYKVKLSLLLKQLYTEYGLSPDYQKYIDARLQKQITMKF